MNFKAVLFDLDGTLLDTLGDLADSANAALAELGFAGHPVESYRYFVGDGMDMLVRRILPSESLDEQTISRCLSAIKEQYSRRWADKTKPYPGVSELLSALDQRQIAKTILSNKPHEFTVLTVEKLLGDFSFDIVRGVSDETPKKPDPAGALRIAEELSVEPAEILYLGDTDTDMRTANAADMYAAGVLWGFREAEELKANGAKTLLETPLDALKLLDDDL
ncbi:HAD family hydrolase [Planctomycetota bacterium]